MCFFLENLILLPNWMDVPNKNRQINGWNLDRFLLELFFASIFIDEKEIFLWVLKVDLRLLNLMGEVNGGVDCKIEVN